MGKQDIRNWMEAAVMCLPVLLFVVLWMVTLSTGPIYIFDWIVIDPKIFKCAAMFWTIGAIISIALTYFQPHLEKLSNSIEKRIRGKEIYVTMGIFAFLISSGLIICFKVEEAAYGVVYTWEDYLKIPIVTLILTGLVGLAYKMSEKEARDHGKETKRR